MLQNNPFHDIGNVFADTCSLFEPLVDLLPLDELNPANSVQTYFLPPFLDTPWVAQYIGIEAIYPWSHWNS